MNQAYREGDDEINEINEKDSPTNEQFTSPPGEVKTMTAVLLVRDSTGKVTPMVNLPSLEMDHTPTPHEVFRMCADVQDQISSVRIIGEVLRNIHVMNGEVVKAVEAIVKKASLPVQMVPKLRKKEG